MSSKANTASTTKRPPGAFDLTTSTGRPGFYFAYAVIGPRSDRAMQDGKAVGSARGSIHSLHGAVARRKPRLLLRFVGSFLLRFDDRQFLAVLFQLPPRFTRLRPLTAHR
jgi:hypothetical protein